MPIQVTVTSETKEKGVFYAKGIVTAPDGTEKGKASVLVSRTPEGHATLVVSAVAKSNILGNEVKAYKSHQGPAEVAELAKDAELIFSNVTFEI